MERSKDNIITSTQKKREKSLEALLGHVLRKNDVSTYRKSYYLAKIRNYIPSSWWHISYICVNLLSPYKIQTRLQRFAFSFSWLKNILVNNAVFMIRCSKMSKNEKNWKNLFLLWIRHCAKIVMLTNHKQYFANKCVTVITFIRYLST